MYVSNVVAPGAETLGVTMTGAAITVLGAFCAFLATPAAAALSLSEQGGQAHSGVVSHAPTPRHTAKAVPHMESRGIDRWVITMVSLLANRLAGVVDTPRPTAGPAW